MKGKKHHRASGGRTEMVAGGNPEVIREAKERKRGGKVEKDKHLGKPEGEKAKHRRDRPHRASGGRVGADKRPFSSAHRSTGVGGDTSGGKPS